MSDADVKIGRCAALSAPQAFQVEADTVNVQAQLVAATEAEFEARCLQLTGYPNEDEREVPVIFTGKLASWSGLHEVVSVSISRMAQNEGGWLAEVEVQLTRVASWAVPLAQLSTWSNLRDNTQTFGAAFAAVLLGLPASIASVSGFPTGGTWEDVTSADGDVSVWYDVASPVDTDLLFGVDLADWYVGSPTIEAKLAGHTEYLALPGWQVENVPYGLRIGNGLVRFTLSVAVGGGFVSTGDAVNLDVEHFDGSQWEAAKDWRIWGTTYGDIVDVAAVSIMRNTPSTVVVRLECVTDAGPTGGRVTLDVKLRRGHRTLECTLRCDTADTWKVERATTEAGQAIPGGVAAGVRANANDGDGNRYLIFCPDDHTRDTTQGGITADSATDEFRFGIGMEIGGSGSSGVSGDDVQRAAYFAAGFDVVEVVER